MILGLLGLIFLGLILNLVFYEYRVRKIADKPKTFDFTGHRRKK